jgi:hypothetical protein
MVWIFGWSIQNLNINFMFPAILLLLMPWKLLTISVWIRRLHDIDLSGWWVLPAFLISPISFVFLCLKRGTPSHNKHDANNQIACIKEGNEIKPSLALEPEENSGELTEPNKKNSDFCYVVNRQFARSTFKDFKQIGHSYWTIAGKSPKEHFSMITSLFQAAILLGTVMVGFFILVSYLLNIR